MCKEKSDEKNNEKNDDKINLTIYKLLNIYEYYQILCFNKVKENLKHYQEKITDEEQKISINQYIENNLIVNINTKNSIYYNNIYNNYFNNVKTEINSRKLEKQRKEKEKEDISNFNPKDSDIDDIQKIPEEENKKEDNNNDYENNGNVEEDGNNDDENGDEYMSIWIKEKMSKNMEGDIN